MSTERDVVSPELALVCPELAAAARAELPDRPWEAFAPPAPPLRPWLVEPPSQPAAAAADSARHGLRRPGLGTAFGLLALVSLVVTGLLPARDAPTLRPATPAPAAPADLPGDALLGPGAYPLHGGGTLLVADNGRAIAGFDPATRCLTAGATLSAPIASDGSFGVIFSMGEATVELTGRVNGRRISGTYRVRAPGCDSGRVPFGADVLPRQGATTRKR